MKDKSYKKVKTKKKNRGAACAMIPLFHPRLIVRAGVNVGLFCGMLLLNFAMEKAGSAPALRNFFTFAAAVWLVMAQCLMYFRNRIVQGLAAWPRAHGVADKLFWIFFVLTVTAPILSKFAPGWAVTELAMACFMSNVWLLFLCGVFSAVRALFPRSLAPLSRAGESVLIVIALLLFVGAASYEARLEYEVHRVPISLGLPQPLTVTLISDLHLGPVLSTDFCQRVAATVKELDSDAVVLAGDIFDTTKLPPGVMDCIGGLANRRGVFYVTGNHEYINGGVIQWTDELRSRGVFVLENDCVSIPGLCDFVGVNDFSGHRWGQENTPDAIRAFSKCTGEKNAKKIVLAHQPNHVADIVKAADPSTEMLVLSGHVHGGQFFPGTWIVYFFNDFFHGLYHPSPNVQVYVGRGTGQWGARLRLGARAEITKLSIR